MRTLHRSSFACFSFAVLAFMLVALARLPAVAAYQQIYGFSNSADGGDPAATLTFDASGNFYGTTVTGGAYGCGTVFEFKPKGKHWEEVVLYNFTCYYDGKNPYGGVTLHDGNVYGVTAAGGSGGSCAGDGCGVVYVVTPSGEATLYNFTGGKDGSGPGNAPVFDSAGNLYGSTPDGGANGVGVVYELLPAGIEFGEETLHQFTGGNDGSTGSLGSLYVDPLGAIYGVTELGGKYGYGTTFELLPNGNRFKFHTLYASKGRPDAAFPYGGLTSSGGNLFGTTYFGGANGAGAVYVLSTKGPKRGRGTRDLELRRRNRRQQSDDDAARRHVWKSLRHHDDRRRSELLSEFGPSGCGTVFEVSPASSGAWKESILHVFGAGDGLYPYYGLTRGPSGALYGTTAAGGSGGHGIVFALK